MQTTIKTAKPALRLMFGDRELTPQEASRLLRERINAMREEILAGDDYQTAA